MSGAVNKSEASKNLSKSSSATSVHSTQSIHNNSLLSEPEPRTDSLLIDGTELQVESADFADEPDKKKRNVFSRGLHKAEYGVKSFGSSVNKNVKNVSGQLTKGATNVGGHFHKGSTFVAAKVPFLGEFVDFITNKNFFDLAIAFIFGQAVNTVVTSLSNDIISPLFAWAIQQSALSQNYVLIKKPKNWQALNSTFVVDGQFKKPSTATACQAIGCITWNYGNFIQTCINFLITALVIFGIVKLFSMFNQKKVKKTATCEFCAEDMKLEAKKCPHCLEPVPQVKVSTEDEEKSASESEELLKKQDKK